MIVKGLLLTDSLVYFLYCTSYSPVSRRNTVAGFLHFPRLYKYLKGIAPTLLKAISLLLQTFLRSCVSVATKAAFHTILRWALGWQMSSWLLLSCCLLVLVWQQKNFFRKFKECCCWFHSRSIDITRYLLLSFYLYNGGENPLDMEEEKQGLKRWAFDGPRASFVLTMNFLKYSKCV